MDQASHGRKNVMNAALSEAPARSFSSIVREFIEKADGDAASAGEALARALLEDGEMREKYLYEAVRQWAVDRIRTERSKTKYSAGVAASKIVAIDGSVFRVAAQAAAGRLMDVVIWGGKPVRLATQGDLRQSAEKHFQQATSNLHHGRWHVALADALSRNGTSESTVGQCLTERTVAQLWQATENA
jgi:hypothetical protein